MLEYMTPDQIALAKKRRDENNAKREAKRAKWSALNTAIIRAASKGIDLKRSKDDAVISKAFVMPDDEAARNRKRVAKSQKKYSLSELTRTGESVDLFKRSQRMARTQKIGSDGDNATFGKPHYKDGIHSAKR